MAYTVHTGDNLALLRKLPADSIDAIVCDPPYEIEVMGSAWDSTGIAYDVARWRECLRVLKPGGHLVAFSHERTYHRLGVAVEDAGFEIRHQLLWIYGSGFPKCETDITAAIDRNRGDDPRPVCRWLRAELDAREIVPRELDELFSLNGMAGHWCATDENTQPTVPTLEQWAAILAWLDIDDAGEVGELVAHLNRRKGERGENWHARELLGEHDDAPAARKWAANHGIGEAKRGEKRGRTRSAEAARAEGFALALRPSHEPAVLARKPFTGTAYANFLKWGTGALNVAACRVPYLADEVPPKSAHPGGRWPMNVLLDEAAAFWMDGHLDGTARYFYCDKATPAEREAGLEAFPRAAWTDGRKKAANYPSLRGKASRANTHKTVKPIDVMRWLARLVTPPGGTVFDPYTGSGTTGIAAELEGFDFLGVDLDAHNVAIACARIEAAAAGAFRIDTDTGRTLTRGLTERGQVCFEF